MGAIRAIFIAAALFNFVVGGAMIVAPSMFGAMVGMPFDASGKLVLRIAGMLIASYGVGYGFVAARPMANRDLVRLGIVGKSSIVGFALIAWVNGAMPGRAAVPISGDLLFAALFLFALRRIDLHRI